MTRQLCAASVGVVGLAGAVSAQLSPQWVATVPVATSLSGGTQGMVTDAAGVTYLTGVTGPSSNVDIRTAAINPDGSVRWTQTYNGPANKGDQTRGIALGPGGVVYVTGNTSGTGGYANVLLLKYDTASGALLDTVQYSSGFFKSEAGHAVSTDALGNVFVGAGTTGDGPDTMLLKFDSAGTFQWRKTWDGPAASPYSQDYVQDIAIDPSGNPIVMIHGVMRSLHPDYVLIKYDGSDGAVMWEANWGKTSGDFPQDIEVDGAGDVYVTGVTLDVADRFGTIKLDGTNGQLLWEAIDGTGFHNGAVSLAIDNKGGVYISGQTDPDGDRSNSNNDFYSVKRDATHGGQIWVHTYGDFCKRCGDVPGDIAVDSGGNVLIIGQTSSPPYVNEMILFVLDANRGDELDRGLFGGGANEHADGYILRFDAAENTYVGGGYANSTTGASGMATFKYASLLDGCHADCDTSTGVGVLDVFDFLCFQDAFVGADPYACDCDTSTGVGVCDVFDFLCFQEAFVAGCP